MKLKGSLTKQEAEVNLEKGDVADFFEGLLPEFVKQGGGILADTVRYWRWKNQVNIVKQAKKIVDGSGLPKKQIPLKILYPLMENSSLEEEPSMQDKWSSLLANAATGLKVVTPNYVEMLKELSPVEVKILDRIFDEVHQQKLGGKVEILQFDKTKICQWLQLDTVTFDSIIENLFRLGICQAPGSTGIMFGNSRVALRTTELFELTTLGYNFVFACRKPKSN